MTPYYEQDGITIYHGDCREAEAWMGADVLVTDPPYGIAFVSDRRGPRWETAASAERPRSIVGDSDTTVRDWALMAWGEKPALVFGTWKRPRPAGVKHVLTWEKGDHLGMGDLSIPWRPNTEEVYVLGRGFSGHRGTSVLRFQAPPSWASRGRTHPHEKPVSLMSALLAKCPAGVVADPFMGSGPVLAAAHAMGRRAIGVEIEERYCEIAAKRLAQGALPLIGASA